jgi:hypothetical protein
MKKSISEILQECSLLETKQERIDFIRANQNSALLTILQCAYHKNVEWLLPEGDPPFKPCPYFDNENVLHKEARKLYLFTKGGNVNLNQNKREQLFIQLLEAVTASDAALLLSMKNKMLPYKGLSQKFVEEAFPGLLEQ